MVIFMLWTNNSQPPLSPWPEGSWVINRSHKGSSLPPASLSDLFFVDSSRLCNSNLCQPEIKEIPGGFGHRTLEWTFHNLFMSSPRVRGPAQPSRHLYRPRRRQQQKAASYLLNGGGWGPRQSGLRYKPGTFSPSF